MKEKFLGKGAKVGTKMSSDSSNASNAHEEYESSNGSGSVVVNRGKSSSKMTTTFLMKGGANAEDMGEYVTIGMDMRFQCVYTGLARKLGLRPSDIRLYYRGRLLPHNETPFKMGFINNDVVLVYEKDCVTPIIIRPRNYRSQNPNISFTVRSVETLEIIEQFELPLSTPVELLYRLWAARRGGGPSQVTMYVDHVKLSNYQTIGEAGVYSGAYLFGAIGPRSQ